jgi:hypothetical protein
MHVDHAI